MAHSNESEIYIYVKLFIVRLARRRALVQFSNHHFFQNILRFHRNNEDNIHTHTHNQMYYVGYTILFWHTHKLLLRVRARAHIPRDTSLEIEFTNEPKKKKKYTHSTNNNNRNIKIKNKRAQLTY